MLIAQQDSPGLAEWAPALIVFTLTLAAVVIARWYTRRRSHTDRGDLAFRSQLGTAAILVIGLLGVIFVLPDEIDSDLAFSVFGLIVTGALAISSQSIIAETADSS